MAMMWWQKKVNDKGEEEVALSKEVDDKLNAGAEASAKVDKLTEIINDMKSIMVTDAESRKAEREAAERRAAAARQAEITVSTTEELENLFITNPAEAVRKMTDPLASAIMETRADNIRRELFEDTEKFPYYSGDIKREIDNLIAGQRLDFKVNPANLENAYHTVLGKHTPELVEGKLKKRFAGGENGSRGTSSGSAGSSGAGGKEPITYDAETMKDLERAAKVTGITVKDYIELYEKEGVI